MHESSENKALVKDRLDRMYNLTEVLVFTTKVHNKWCPFFLFKHKFVSDVSRSLTYKSKAPIFGELGQAFHEIMDEEK